MFFAKIKDMLQDYISLIKEYPYIIAPFLGLIPALLWLWFWLKEDTHPEPLKMIILSFLGGMIAVILVIPPQQLVLDYLKDQTYLSFLLWATIEEVFKFGTVYFIALRSKANDEPVDSIIYLIVSALGFVALENTFFLTNFLKEGDFFGLFITGNLRFLGASLLHIMSSATIGICMALSFYKNKLKRFIYAVVGIIIAIILHTSFNIYIIKDTTSNVFIIFGIVWIGIIVLLLLFEKAKHIIPNKNL